MLIAPGFAPRRDTPSRHAEAATFSFYRSNLMPYFTQFMLNSGLRFRISCSPCRHEFASQAKLLCL